ncbi:MAG: sugar-binding protein [Phaeodactylibacter sp.]|uniref:sugar-binding protein n=1 Tax=Phaeodactylibacter sp. TaxID=1940289 RepID=UPI0032ECB8AD
MACIYPALPRNAYFGGMNASLPTYTVERTEIHEHLFPNWQPATILRDFSSPWLEVEDTGTTFRALHDGVYLYFRFDVQESNILIYEKDHTKFDVLNSERVEIFFRQDPELKRYYGLEMDPLGRVYDYQSSYYRQSDKTWGWPEGHLNLKTGRTPTGYWLQGEISFESLRSLQLIHEERYLQAGLYRGRCLNIRGDKATFNWITWVDPQTETPDFHVPASFGQLELG